MGKPSLIHDITMILLFDGIVGFQNLMHLAAAVSEFLRQRTECNKPIMYDWFLAVNW